MKRRVLGFSAAALAAAAFLAGCGSDGSSAGNIPTASIGQPPGGSTQSNDGSSSQPDGSSGSSPKVTNPIDSNKFLSDPCGSMSPSARQSLGLGEGKVRQDVPACSWKFVEADTTSIIVTPHVDNKNGMSDIFDIKDTFEYFEPVTVAGYPAAISEISDNRASGHCGLYVGMNDQLALRVGVARAKSDPCPVATKAAEAIMQTLQTK